MNDNLKRLEEIEADIENNAKKEYEFITTLLYEDALYLVRQAKKVPELERDRAEWEIESHTQNARNERLEQENQRYKEALEFYADGETYTDDRQYTSTGTLVHTGFTKIECDCGEKARQALRGEST